MCILLGVTFVCVAALQNFLRRLLEPYYLNYLVTTCSGPPAQNIHAHTQKGLSKAPPPETQQWTPTTEEQVQPDHTTQTYHNPK